MRKFYFKNLGATVAITTMMWGNVWGQVARNNFSQSAGTFSAISGGTLHGTAVDDNNYSFTLPFTFSYNGTGYTVARPTSNGFLVLGGSAPSTSQYTPLSSGTTNFAISALGRDLNSTIRSEVLGTTPNRVYVCQWSSAYRYAVGSSENLNFQIRLYETTNEIEIIYGSISTPNTTWATGASQVGLRGSANTDFNVASFTSSTLTGYTYTLNWQNLITASSNTDVVGITSTIFPASGTTLKWSPSTCAQPTVSTTSTSITSTGFTIGWTNSATYSSGYDVRWRKVDDLPSVTSWATPTTVAAGSSSYAVTGLSNSTYYIYSVQGKCGASSQSNLSQVTTANLTNARGLTQTLAACPNLPSALTSNTITTTTANVAWTAASPAPGSGYEYFVSTSATAPTAGTTPTGSVGAGIVTAALTSLSPATQYYYWVRSNCNGTDKSSWVGSGTFNTQILVATPYSEPFTTTTTPSGWAITGWTIGSIRGVTGNPGNNIYKNLYNLATTGTFTTINVGPISSGQLLTFDWKTANYTGFAAPGASTGDFVVSISTDWGATYTTINTTSTGANNTWNAYSYNLSSYAGQNVKIRIVGNWVSGDYDLAFDNFKIETPPSCLPPTITATTSIAATTASINWTAPGTAPSNGYQWEVRSSGAGGSGGAGLVASGTVAAGVLTASAAGLAASTGYTVYVRSDCGGSGFSTWASGGAFTTEALTPTPYSEPFTTTTTPSGWGITGWTIGSIRGVTGNPGNNIYKNLYNLATTGTFTTINVGPISSGQLLTFDWKTANYTGFAAPGASTGDFVVSISTDWGATYTTINTTSTGANNTWNAYSYNLSSYAGQNVKIRIVGNWVSGDYDLAFDNFKIETPPAPTITSVTSSQTCHDTTKVVIIGTNLTGISAASINGVSLMNLDSNTSTRAVKFMTTAFATGGNVSVTTGGGTGTFANTLAFTISPALAIDSPNFAICRGSTSTAVSVTAATIGNYSTYAWTPTIGVTSPSASSTTFTPSANTTYTLTGTGGGCSRARTLTITMADTPSRLTLSQGVTKPKCEARIDSLMASGGIISNIVAHTENFNGASSWTTANNSTGGTPAAAAWTLRANGYAYNDGFSNYTFNSNDNSQFYLSNSDAQGSGSTTNSELISPTINLTDYVSASISYFSHFDFNAVSDRCYVEVSSTGVSPWTRIDSINGADFGTITGFAQKTTTIPSTFLNSANTKVRFVFISNWGFWWAIDNVSITGNKQQNITWSPTAGLFTDRAASAAYTSGHAAKLYSKPSATTKYYAQAQNGICIVRDSIIDSAKATTDMVILALGSASGASAQCTDGGWTYYGTTADPDKLIFAIQKGAWTNGNETVTIGVNGSPYSSTLASNGPNQHHRSWLMGRDWDVTAATQPASPVLVRFFYDPADTTAVNTDRDAAFAALPGGTIAVKTPFEWFKTTTVPYNAAWRSAIVGNKFPATHIKLTPTYGTQNGVNYAEFSIASFSGGTGGAGFGPSGGGGGGVGLPVTWAGFDVKTVEAGNELIWKTASEQNTHYFEVQYSYDAKEFIAIPEHIPAAGNSADLRTYNFMHSDFAPFVYYRIKQVDLDSKFEYSAIKLAKRTAGPSFVVNVFPIPIQDDNLIHISAKGVDKSTMSITMTDITGKVIRHLSYIPSSESIKESFDMSPLTPGVYFIEVQNGQGKETFKVSR